MNIYHKIKIAYANYEKTCDRSRRCMGCPSAILLENINITKESVQNQGGCASYWRNYASKIGCPSDPSTWYYANKLSNCPGCRDFALKLSKKMFARSTKI